MSEIFGSRSRGSSGPRPKTSSSRSAWIFSCSSKFRGTRWSAMISFTMPDTAWRAWLELTRDNFSRSSLEIRVRCISALYFSRFSNSTFCLPREIIPVHSTSILNSSLFPQKSGMEAESSSSTHLEDHIHRGLHFHGLVVEQVGPVAPGLHGVESSLAQRGRPTDYVEIFDHPRFGYGGMQHHRALYAGGTGEGRINGVSSRNQPARHDAAGNVERP